MKRAHFGISPLELHRRMGLPQSMQIVALTVDVYPVYLHVICESDDESEPPAQVCDCLL